ncbi:hypothetical protein DSO57_1035704 [Entomophthora muscae]|uniref:Uncharacterized protein n=1 Tax=Entomophthora muscae TaxID=34485 RepID=A0ACC2TAG6_9FUNG|nr:hypothetical protein DSO57_1035704 [Entomophthora muscae]
MTHAFVIIYEIDHVVHGSPKLLLRVIRVITMGLPGFLNCLAFIADPAFRQACETFKVYFRNLPFAWPLETFRDHIVPRFQGPDASFNDEPTPTHRDSITSEQHILAAGDAAKPPSLQSAATEEQQFNDYIKSL